MAEAGGVFEAVGVSEGVGLTEGVTGRVGVGVALGGPAGGVGLGRPGSSD